MTNQTHPQSGLALYTQKLDDEINKFAEKTEKCKLQFITDNIMTINGFLGELDKASRFAVLPQDLEKRYRELKVKYELYKEILENDCECMNRRQRIKT